MKNEKFYTLVFLVMFCSGLSGQADNTMLIHTQLQSINQGWENKIPDNVNHQLLPESDAGLIQMHLSLVEQTLRKKHAGKLSGLQKNNRLKCLDLLNTYHRNGVFPVNSFHKKRTPYFIDNYGTACAVGELIKLTGHEELATKIAAENNFEYIENLNKLYPELKSWATENGFEIDELAWIQPAYCYNPPGENIKTDVSCYGGFDGFFGPMDFSQFPDLVPPITTDYNLYRWTDNEWVALFNSLGCDLIAGTYKRDLIDAEGTTAEYIVEINEPDPIVVNITGINEDGNCNGTATVETEGGTGFHLYEWSTGVTVSNTLTDLCAGIYTLTVTDENDCMQVDSFQIFNSASILETEKLKVNLYPNPTYGNLSVQLPDAYGGDTKVAIYNVKGHIVLTKVMQKNDLHLNIEALPAGIYFVETTNKSNRGIHKVVKQ